MIFGRKPDISRAKNADEAIDLIVKHLSYMQEALEQNDKKLLQQIKKINDTVNKGEVQNGG